MSSTQVESLNRKPAKPSVKDQPWYAVPAILAIIMLSSGGFMLLLAQAIKIFSSMGY